MGGAAVGRVLVERERNPPPTTVAQILDRELMKDCIAGALLNNPVDLWIYFLQHSVLTSAAERAWIAPARDRPKTLYARGNPRKCCSLAQEDGDVPPPKPTTDLIQQPMTKIGPSGVSMQTLAHGLRASSSDSSQDRTKTVELKNLAGAASQATADLSNASIPPELLVTIRGLQGTGDTLYRAAFFVFFRHRLASNLRSTTTLDSLDALAEEVIEVMASDRELRASILIAGEALIQRSAKLG